MDAREELKILLGVRGVTTGLVGRRAGVSGQAASAMQRGRLRVSDRVVQAARLVVIDLAIDGLTVLRRCLATDDGGE